MDIAVTESFMPTTSAKSGCVLYHISLFLIYMRREPQYKLGTTCGVAWLKNLYSMRDNQTNHRLTHGNLIGETKYEVGIKRN